MKKIKESNGGKLPHMILDQVLSSADCESTHVTIAISGWLSKQDDKAKKWEGIKKHFQCGQPSILDNAAAVYGLTWESKSTHDLFRILGETAATLVVNGLVVATTGVMGRLAMLVCSSKGISDVPRI